MLYDITVRIEYDYEYPADSSRHLVRLMPADLPGVQRLVAGSFNFSPQPDEQETLTDFFGNRAVSLAFFRRHEDIVFSVVSRVEHIARDIELDTSPSLARLSGDIAALGSVAAWSPHHFVSATNRVPVENETTAFARETVNGAMSAFDAVRAVGEALHRTLRYDDEATTVDTPMIEAFRNRNGVCQDFSHIMIACLRGIGIPAGYVSGFLRTIPPPGKPRLEGADAMHAWVRAWCGIDMGWVEYDPTNGMLVGADHIVVARGRDYFDVAPVKGVMRSFGEHTTKQSVDVVPVVRKAG